MSIKREDIIKSLECCLLSNEHQTEDCEHCPFNECSTVICQNLLAYHALSVIKKLIEENNHLDYTLLGVMHSVDKWLDDAELEQDEVNRAATMREKTLQIVEGKQAEIDRLKGVIKANAHSAELAMEAVQKALVNAQIEIIDEFAERACDELQTGNIIMDKSIKDIIYYLANKIKEELK